MADYGTDLEPAPYLLRQVHRHLLWVACSDEVLEKRRREVLGEDPLVAKAPQVEFESFGFDQPSLWPWLHGTTSSRSAVIGPLASRPRTSSCSFCSMYLFLCKSLALSRNIVT